MTQPDLADSPLERARDALRRHAWQQCFELFTAAEVSQSLSPEDLADMAEAAWASGHQIECIQARERAYAAFAERKDTRRAARQALDLLHATEATRRGHDYSGKGIHEAARIAALGNGGEILASEQTLADASGGFATSEARTVSLKGIAKPVQVVSVDWR